MAESIDSAFSQVFSMYLIFPLLIIHTLGVYFSEDYQATPTHAKIYFFSDEDFVKSNRYHYIEIILDDEMNIKKILNPDNIPLEWVYKYLVETDINNKLYGPLLYQSFLLTELTRELRNSDITLTQKKKQELLDMLLRVQESDVSHDPPGFSGQFQRIVAESILELQKYEP